MTAIVVDFATAKETLAATLLWKRAGGRECAVIDVTAGEWRFEVAPGATGFRLTLIGPDDEREHLGHFRHLDAAKAAAVAYLDAVLAECLAKAPLPRGEVASFATWAAKRRHGDLS
jgi:hypothetical protein